ncbi:hypothetical protein Tco_0522991 [Tanacetum coccineum]
MDLDSPEDDEPIIVQDESDEEVHAEKVQTEEPKETEDASASHPPSPKTVKIQELSTQLLVLQTLNSKLVMEKEAPEDEAAWFKAQPLYPNVEQLTQLLLKKHVHELEIKLPGDLKLIPNKLETFTSIVSISYVQAKIETLDALPSLLNKITEAFTKFAQGEKNTQHAIISQLFQRKATKDAEKANLNKPIPTITTPTTSIIPPIITTTTTQLQSPFHPSPPKISSQPEGELIKKEKGKEAKSSKDIKEEKIESDSNDDTINLTGSIVETSKKKKLNKFDFITEQGDHVYFIEEQIKEQKRIEESVKADVAKHDVEIRKEELIDLLRFDIVTDVLSSLIVDQLDTAYVFSRIRRSGH